MKNKILKKIGSITLSCGTIMSSNFISQITFAMDDNNHDAINQHNVLLDRLNINNSNFLYGINKFELKNRSVDGRISWDNIISAANATLRGYGNAIKEAITNISDDQNSDYQVYCNKIGLLQRNINTYLNNPEIEEVITADGWEYTESNHTLVIKNDSAMNYNMGKYCACVPWKNIKKRIRKIIIKNCVTFIGRDAFYDCNNLTKVIFENESQLKKLMPKSFCDCTSLTEIKLPESVTDIEWNAFNWCTNLRKITIPSNVKNIGSSAFYTCKKLTEINFESNSKIKYIGNSAFSGCVSLQSATLPKNVEFILSIKNRLSKNCEIKYI